MSLINPVPPDENLLTRVCRTLEAAGLSVVVVVAADEASGMLSASRKRRARRSHQVADLSSNGELAGKPRAGRGALVNIPSSTLQGKAGSRASRSRGTGEPVIVLTTAPNEALAREALSGVGFGLVTFEPQETSDEGASADKGEGNDAGAAAEPLVDKAGIALTRRNGLTVREVEVLRAFANGATTAEVARDLFVSPKTVKNHLAHLYAKLGATSRTQAVAMAVKRGIVNIS